MSAELLTYDEWHRRWAKEFAEGLAERLRQPRQRGLTSQEVRALNRELLRFSRRIDPRDQQL